MRFYARRGNLFTKFMERLNRRHRAKKKKAKKRKTLTYTSQQLFPNIDHTKPIEKDI